MLVDDPVKRVDNMTMAWGLEARVPFLDHELVELAAACPPELKLAARRQGRAQGGGAAASCRTRSSTGRRATSRCRPSATSRARSWTGCATPLTDPAAKDRGLFRRDWLDAMLADPNTHAHHPRLERAVAGRAAGDVAAGEGDLADCPSFIERLAARRGPISYTAPAPSPDGLRLAWISDVDGRPRAWLADLDRPAR